ncbi:MAG: hypothetical protein ACLFPA_11315 [Dichotomicrobium sp.]
MITVRFETGLVLRYSQAYFVEHWQGHHKIKQDKDGRTIAIAPNSAVVELERPTPSLVSKALTAQSRCPQLAEAVRVTFMGVNNDG